MDLVRCQAGRRVEAREFGVARLAVRRVPQADRLAGLRQVIVDDVLFQLRVRRHDGLHDRIARGSLQARLLSGRNRIGHLPERFVERARGRVRDDLLVELRRHALHDDLRRHLAALHAFAHQGDVLVDELVERADATQPLLVVLDRLEHDDVRHAVHRRQAAALRERCVLRAVVVGVDSRLVLAAEQVPVQPVLRRQLLRVDLVERGNDGLIAVIGSLQGRRGEVRPPVVEAVVADVGGTDRVFAQAALPFGVEQCMQVLGSTRFILRLQGGGQRQGEQQEQGGQGRAHAGTSLYRRARCSGPGRALASHCRCLNAGRFGGSPDTCAAETCLAGPDRHFCRPATTPLENINTYYISIA